MTTKSILDLQKEFAIEAVAQPDPSVELAKRELLIEALREENEFLQKEIQKLRVEKRTSNGLLNIPAEEIICLEQIEILGSKSALRELSLDEVKRLDLLVKNLKLIRDKTDDAIDIPNLEKIGEDNLVAIARGEA